MFSTEMSRLPWEEIGKHRLWNFPKKKTVMVLIKESDLRVKTVQFLPLH
jgi:hypothetical protein